MCGEKQAKCRWLGDWANTVSCMIRPLEGASPSSSYDRPVSCQHMFQNNVMPINEEMKDGIQPLSSGEIPYFNFPEFIAPLTWGSNWLLCGNPRLTVRLTVRAGSGVSDLRRKAVPAQPQFRIARHQAMRITHSQAAESGGRRAKLKRQAAG